MANADFSQNKQAASGGFDSGSYRAAPKAESEPKLTAGQKKLAALEAKLPKALGTQAAAIALSAVIILAGFFGCGSAKIRARYNKVASLYTSGLAADGGYTLSEELAVRENTAANVITTAKNEYSLGESAEAAEAKAALDSFAAARAAISGGSGLAEAYEANERLDKAIDNLYAKMQEKAADPMKMGAVQGQFGQFNAAQTIIGALTYNDEVSKYNAETGGFPASILKITAGVKEAEQFA